MSAATSHRKAPQRQGLRRRTHQPVGGRVTIALDAFPELPLRTTSADKNNADFWEAKAREYIALLSAALVLHKQMTSGVEVPRSLSGVLTIGQREIAALIKHAIKYHTINGGTRADELNEATEAA